LTSRTSAPRARSATKRGISSKKLASKPGPGEFQTDLMAIRSALLAELKLTGGTSLASVARELRIVSEKLDQLRPRKASVLDEIAQRRDRRRAAAADS
jgi:hypothetical protein